MRKAAGSGGIDSRLTRSTQSNIIDVYKQYYDKAGETIRILKKQSSDPVIWPVASLSQRNEAVQVIPGRDSINFNAV